MPKREDDTYRYTHGHPPTCTCVECINKRLRRLRREAHPSYISICPRCGKKSLFYNGRDRIYECLNLRCKASGRTLGELRGHGYGVYMTPDETNRAAAWAAETQRKISYRKNIPASYKTKPTRSRRSWLVPVLIFSILFILFGVYKWWNASNVVSPPVTGIPPTQEIIPPTPPPVIPIPPTPKPSISTAPTPLPDKKDVDNIKYINAAGADGHRITLVNNPDATNPTWGQLKAFLAQDDTSEHPYDLKQFVCADFAEQLHNRAEAAGIRAAFVSITLPDFHPPSGYAAGHALNAFRLADWGNSVEADKNCYIDSTNNLIGISWGDSVAFIESGKPYEAAPAAFVDLIQENGEWYWIGYSFGLHPLITDAVIEEIDIQW